MEFFNYLEAVPTRNATKKPLKTSGGMGGGSTLVSFTLKDETMQNPKNPKEIVSLTLIFALMCPKTQNLGKIKKLKIAITRMLLHYYILEWWNFEGIPLSCHHNAITISSSGAYLDIPNM